MITHYTPNEQV